MSDAVFSPSITILFNGKAFDQWERVSLAESVDDMCTSLQLDAVWPFSGDALGLSANTVVQVWVDDDLVATVRPDIRQRRVSASSHAITLAARSLAREFVDCQYSAAYSGLPLADVAKRLAKVFAVPLQVVGGTPLVPEFAMQSEQPANALINAARAANKLLYPTPDGGVILTDPAGGSALATLRYGEHIASYAVVDEDRLRFSEYIVRSFDYAASAARKGAAKDEGISYFRPMHIVGDRMGGSDGASGRRATLERNRRQARAHRYEVQVKGWHYMDGGKPKLWRVNTPVRLVIEPEGIDDVLLLADRTLSYDGQAGRTTEMVLMRREAFLGEPTESRKRRASGTGGR